MLSRIAESLFWIGRYIERAENAARQLHVNYYATLESSGQFTEEWGSLLDIMGNKASFAQKYGRADASTVPVWLAFDRSNPSSISSSLMRARENARGLRDRIPSEMWELMNQSYHALCFQDEAVLARDGLYDYCVSARAFGQSFFGIAFATVPRDEGWMFMRTGQMLERADNMLRLVKVNYRRNTLDLAPAQLVEQHNRWIALLKSASAYEAFRKRNHGDISPHTIAQFLLLDRDFPRSVVYCAENLYDALERLDRIHPGSHPHLLREAKWILARLEHAEVTDIFGDSDSALEVLLGDLNELGQAISRAYFTYTV